MASSSKKSAGKANLLGKRDPKYDLETEPILKKHKEKSEEKETTKGFADSLQQIKGTVELLETKSDQANLIPVKETVEGLDYVEAVAARKRTLAISRLGYQTTISDIINFFKDVGRVVCVRRFVNFKCYNSMFGSVEFASANEAKKAMEKKNGEYLCGNKITLGMANKMPPYPPRPMYCIEHKVWYEDYLRPESFPIEEEGTPPHISEAVAAIEDTLFVANLSPLTKISHVIEFFGRGGKFLRVRLIVNHEGKHVGYGFVQFASACAAKKALEKKNGRYLHGHKLYLEASYSPRPKYSLAEKLWYEDYLLRESLLTEEDETLEGLHETPNFVEAVAIRKKTLSVSNLSRQTKMSDIINFFKDVGEVVRVLRNVRRNGHHLRYGFVEFASANEAKKAQEKKNGEYLCGNMITLDVAEMALLPKYCIDHKVWYEDYLRRESLLIEEDEAVEGLDETPDLVEEVAVRKKTHFFANVHYTTTLPHIVNFFKDVAEVITLRLIVDYEGEHVGCGFVEFASVNEAKKALYKKLGEKLCGRRVFLFVAEIAPYPLRPMYNLAEKLWYEDYLRRESLLIEEDDLETKPNLKKQKKLMGVFCGKKITFSDDD